MNYIGIDPGQTGGIAFVNDETVLTFVMPQKKEKGYDIGRIGKILESFKSQGPLRCYMEKLNGFPGMASNSTFNLGKGYGILIGVLGCLDIEVSYVPARTWQAVMWPVFTEKNLDSKYKSFIASQKVFPAHNFLKSKRCSRPHDGMIDAALIAEYGRLKNRLL